MSENQGKENMQLRPVKNHTIFQATCNKPEEEANNIYMSINKSQPWEVTY
jgi:hypothetical protein